ncbi:hypothetical protein [Aquimarina sediminis]|uniref:hypothetical protein n=1 Tax=Aquimarina sediminis TaxID=2070536 RepID=UPI000FFE4286|nr:hypothetical protein [Aquimarina sediminis]
MKKFTYIIISLLSFGCANNASSESKTMDIEASESYIEAEEASEISENDAYILLITQKLEEYLDRETLAITNPNFNVKIDSSKLLSTEKGTKLKKVSFISSFEAISDSVKKVTTKVVLDHKTDTILTFIKTSKIEIDGEQLISTKISFDTIPKNND